MSETCLTLDAVSRSSYPVTLTFKDEQGNLISPTSANFTLTDINGKVINSRSEVNIASLSSSVTILLSGDDIDYKNGSKRYLLIQAEYDSDLGAGLPLRDQVAFYIKKIIEEV